MVPRRRAHRAPHPGLHPLERGGHGRQGQPSRRRHRRPPRRPSPRRPRSTRSASTTSSGARTAACAGDHVYIQGHAAPGIYARAFLEGRLDEDQLDHFRREIGGRGLSSYPHPRLMPDFWEYPTVSMGLGPIASIYQARFNRYLQQPPASTTPSQSRVWCFVGDGETDEPETLGVDLAGRPRAARQPDLGRQLQPAAPRRPGAGQRQDHPGARGRLPGRRLERHQGHLGLEVGRAAGPRRRRRAAQQDEHHRRRRVPALRRRVGRLHPRPLLRPRPAAAQAWSTTSPTRTCAACPAAATTTGSSTPPTRPPPSRRGAPTVILAKTIKGWTLGAGASRPATPPTRSRR